MTRIMLLIFGAVLTIGGTGILLLLFFASAADTGSVGVLIARGDLDAQTVRAFRFTPWQEPMARIRPFPSRSESFEKGAIIRFRQGSRTPNLLIRQTYYEAEYLMPDGKTVVGPALGPTPFTSPNYPVLVPVIVSGAVMLILGTGFKHKKSKQAIIQGFDHE